MLLAATESIDKLLRKVGVRWGRCVPRDCGNHSVALVVASEVVGEGSFADASGVGVVACIRSPETLDCSVILRIMRVRVVEARERRSLKVGGKEEIHVPPRM